MLIFGIPDGFDLQPLSDAQLVDISHRASALARIDELITTAFLIAKAYPAFFLDILYLWRDYLECISSDFSELRLGVDILTSSHQFE